MSTFATLPAFVARPRFARPHASASPKPLTVGQLATAYRWPATVNGVSLDGTGVTVAILQLGGVYFPSDLAAACARNGVKVPKIVVVEVAGASQVSDPGGADVEVALDVQVVAAGAPGATILLVFCPNTEAGYAAGVDAAVEHGAHIITTSWGLEEDQWSSAGLTTMEASWAAAEAGGVVCVAAAGDQGADDGGRRATADYPASSPHVIGCAGTRLIVDPTTGARLSETVWDDGPTSATGGAPSRIFARPAWQPAAVGKYRTVPDVASNGDPVTGVLVCSGGVWSTVGGTSMAAPTVAAMLARFIQGHGGQRITGLAPLIYGNDACFDVTTGSGRDTEKAAAGYDEAAGLGVLDGVELATLLAATGPTPPPVNPPPPSSGTPTLAEARAAWATVEAWAVGAGLA
jgi:kumamolisin